jgi:micrococcal nuclease
MEGYTPPPPKPGGGGGNCDPSYPDVCIPPYPPDLDCGDIPFSDFRVRGSDPHGFDGDNDGIGCEG